MAGILRREAVYLWYYFSLQLGQIFRYWVLGMVLGSVITVFAKDRIHGVFRSQQGKSPQLILYSAALGSMALIIRIVCCFLCGTLAGLLVRRLYRGESFFDFPDLKSRKAKTLTQIFFYGS